MAYDRPRDSSRFMPHLLHKTKVDLYFGCVAVRVFSHLVPFMPPARAFTAGATSAGKGRTSYPSFQKIVFFRILDTVSVVVLYRDSPIDYPSKDGQSSNKPHLNHPTPVSANAGFGQQKFGLLYILVRKVRKVTTVCAYPRGMQMPPTAPRGAHCPPLVPCSRW